MCFWMRNYLKFSQFFVIVGKLGTTSPPDRRVKSQVWLYPAWECDLGQVANFSCKISLQSRPQVRISVVGDLWDNGATQNSYCRKALG